MRQPTREYQSDQPSQQLARTLSARLQHAHLAKSPLRFVLGGWSVGSVAMVQSGAPFTVTTQTNTTNAFSAGNLRADVLRNPKDYSPVQSLRNHQRNGWVPSG